MARPAGASTSIPNSYPDTRFIPHANARRARLEPERVLRTDVLQIPESEPEITIKVTTERGEWERGGKATRTGRRMGEESSIASSV